MAKEYQTSETSKVDWLKTRWYKANFQMAKKAVLKVIEDCGFKAEVTDDTYGEIFIDQQKFSMTITIFEYSISETSVDVHYESKRLIDIAAGRSDIEAFYIRLNDYLEFKGLSLHP